MNKTYCTYCPPAASKSQCDACKLHDAEIHIHLLAGALNEYLFAGHKDARRNASIRAKQALAACGLEVKNPLRVITS